ncbi:hypothetical protein QQ045_012104 [Rhodiola kirilowii]
MTLSDSSLKLKEKFKQLVNGAHKAAANQVDEHLLSNKIKRPVERLGCCSEIKCRGLSEHVTDCAAEQSELDARRCAKEGTTAKLERIGDRATEAGWCNTRVDIAKAGPQRAVAHKRKLQ